MNSSKNQISSSIHIGQLNLQNSAKATTEARQIIQDFKFDFLLCQEPYSVGGAIRGFGLTTSNMVLGNRPDQERPMAGIICNPRLDPLELTHLETPYFTIAKINTITGPLNMISAYFQCALEIGPFIDETQKILNKIGGQMFLMCADINAHSTAWHDAEEDQKGTEFEQFIIKNGLMIVNRPNFPSTHKSGRNIDITICNRALKPFINEWKVYEDKSLSDHRLITLKIDLTLKNRASKSDSINIKKANFKRINEELENAYPQMLEQIPSRHMEIESLTERTTILFQNTLNRNAPRLIDRDRVVPWWTKELTKQRKSVQKARKSYQKCCPCRIKLVKQAIWLREKIRYKALMKTEKQKSWEAFVRETSNADPYGIAYKLGANKLRTKEILSTLKTNNEFTESNLDTLTLLVDQLIPQDMHLSDNETHVQLRQQANELQLSYNTEPPFSLDELEVSLKKAKDRRAPGPDGLPAEFFKKFNHSNKMKLLKHFNICWTNNIFPKIWKSAKMKIIRKSGDRDWTQPKSYRPISLMSVQGKIYERLITNRMNNHISDNNIISQSQFGFRKGIGSINAIEKVKNLTINSQSKYVIVILVDIQGAFDSVWWPTILLTLQKLNFSRNIQETISSYLSEREIFIKHDGETITRKVNLGCPQGSVLGPILWNLTFDNLLSKEYPPEVTPVAFADDIAYVIRGNSRRILEQAATTTGRILTTWAKEAKMTIAVNKTKGLILKGKLPGRPPAIRINGSPIIFVNEASYLGVTLDNRLTFLPHVKTIGVKASKLFGKLSRILKLKFGVKYSNLQILYKTVFVPIVSYASRIWDFRLQNGNIIRSLLATQRKVLLCISGAYCTTSLHALCVVRQVLPLDLKLKQIREVWESKRLLRNEVPNEVIERIENQWQEIWNTSTRGRYTFKLFPNIRERNILRHLQDITHVDIQILTGHGAFGTYLHKHNKRETSTCELCKQTEDDPTHGLLECNELSQVRYMMEEEFDKINLPRPWNLSSTLRIAEGTKIIFSIWKQMHELRNL